MRRKINVQLVSISIIAIVATMLVMLFVFYDLFQTQVQDDLRANAIVLKNTGIFHSGNENALHMDYRKLRVTWISATGTVLYDNDSYGYPLFLHLHHYRKEPFPLRIST